MKKLFLTSTFAQVAHELTPLLTKPATELTVAFIPTAADVYADKWFIEADRAKLVEMGFQLVDVSIKDIHGDELTEILSGVDIIFVAGGNVFYLLEQARISGFLNIVPRLVENGVMYIVQVPEVTSRVHLSRLANGSIKTEI